MIKLYGSLYGNYMFNLNLLKECIWFIGIEDFVAVHHRNQILSITQIDDIVRIAGEHVNGLNLVATHFPLQHLAFGVIKVALLNQSVTFHHNELLPFRIMPMLSFSNARFTDVYAYLSRTYSMDQLSKTSSFINIHFQREGNLFFWKIAQVSAIQFFGKTTRRYLRNRWSSERRAMLA